MATGGTYTIIEGTAPDPEPEPEPKPEWENPFDDVKEDLWYYEGVAKVCAAGLMSGTDKGFEPELKLTRGMLMTMLARLNGQDASGDGVRYRKGMDRAVSSSLKAQTCPLFRINRSLALSTNSTYVPVNASIGNHLSKHSLTVGCIRLDNSAMSFSTD